MNPASSFDLWLSRELRRAYDTTLAEQVPEDLLRLLERISADGK